MSTYDFLLLKPFPFWITNMKDPGKYAVQIWHLYYTSENFQDLKVSMKFLYLAIRLSETLNAPPDPRGERSAGCPEGNNNI